MSTSKEEGLDREVWLPSGEHLDAQRGSGATGLSMASSAWVAPRGGSSLSGSEEQLQNETTPGLAFGISFPCFGLTKILVISCNVGLRGAQEASPIEGVMR